MRSGAPSVLKRPTPEGFSQDEVRDFNTSALRQGDVSVHRVGVLGFLAVPSEDVKQPFRKPTPSGWRMPVKERGLGNVNKGGRKSLGLTGLKSSMMLTSQSAFKPVIAQGGDDDDDVPEEEMDDLARRYEPLLLYEGEGGYQVVVDTVIGKWLREHQRVGLQFLFECICGLREFEGCGCILADDMGLGKTLQSITLIYTVLRHGLVPGQPLAKRVIVVTPTSLVRNWENEIDKWLKGRVKTLALAEASRDVAIKQIKSFTGTRNYQVLVLSYDTFRIHCALFAKEDSCDLLICDEAHRLKNDQTQTSLALDTLKCKRRVLLSGTPMQNDLEEFFAMVNFCNPTVLGTVSRFRKYYQNPILIGREPDATEEETKLSDTRSTELAAIINMFILRRTNSLLSKHLPPKLTQVVCVQLSDMQKEMYRHIIRTKLDFLEALGDSKSGVSSSILASINALKKLCNHPQLLYQKTSIYSNKKNAAYGLDDINQFFPQGFGEDGGSRRRSSEAAVCTNSLKMCNSEWSGKFMLCERLLRLMRKETSDRIVIVSNYTQTLDQFSLLCKENNFPFLRLDGSSSGKKRQAMVDRLNDPLDDIFVFLLSSKAGGCGLNMIGANRLILFDPDWNPATDKQAAARVWRDGQKKRTYVYRFVATGTIEEKIFQRQLSKEGLQSVVAEDQNMESMLSSNDLRDLFTLREDTVSDTHDKYKCDRCMDATLQACDKSVALRNPGPPLGDVTNNDPPARRTFSGPRKVLKVTKVFKEMSIASLADADQIGMPGEGDLNEWSHHVGTASTDDDLLRRAGKGLVSFVFGQVIDSDLLDAKAEKAAEMKKQKLTAAE